MRAFQQLASTAATAKTVLSRAPAGSQLTTALSAKRTFSSLPNLRPTLFASGGAVFRSPSMTLSRLPSTAPDALSSAASASDDDASACCADLVPRSSITSHPALAGIQIRCGPRPTTAKASRLVRKRRHGFLSRVSTRNGRKTLQRRRNKKRSWLSM